ncbi:MAG: hypothetical protein ACYDH5_03120 [Acidimicrobiales bacterium]
MRRRLLSDPVRAKASSPGVLFRGAALAASSAAGLLVVYFVGPESPLALRTESAADVVCWVAAAFLFARWRESEQKARRQARATRHQQGPRE